MRIWFAAFLLCFAVQAQAGLSIQITQGLKDATPIAVVPFSATSTNATAVGQKIAHIVNADLHRSGMFAPLAPDDLLSRPASEKDIIYRDFRVLGVPYLVIGQVTATGSNSFQVRYGLYNTNREHRLVTQTFKMTKAQLRDVAHAISDKVFETLTGIRGVFDTKILYVTFNRHAEYPYQLQYADADGARSQTILRSKRPIMSPAWSPDGKKVAYVSFEKNGLPAIFIHTLATGQRHMLTRYPGINSAPAFSPDGKKLALTLSKDGNTEIYLLNLQTHKLTRLTDNYAIDTGAAWMPDGNSILFTSGRSGGPQIYRYNLENGNVSRMTFNGSYNARASVTPNGRFMVYVHRRNGNFNIAVQDLVRNTFRIVTQTKLDESPSIAPNGSMIIYGTQHEGESVLEAVSIDGRVKIRLPSEEGEVRDPAWSPYM